MLSKEVKKMKGRKRYSKMIRIAAACIVFLAVAAVLILTGRNAVKTKAGENAAASKPDGSD